MVKIVEDKSPDVISQIPAGTQRCDDVATTSGLGHDVVQPSDNLRTTLRTRRWFCDVVATLAFGHDHQTTMIQRCEPDVIFQSGVGTKLMCKFKVTWFYGFVWL